MQRIHADRQDRKEVAMAEVEQSNAAAPAATQQHEGEDGYYPEEEIVTGNWNLPQVEVNEVAVVTGEENEDVFWRHRSKLYRWSADTAEWKERGLGESKLLTNKETGRIRFLLRQEKTMKIVANHFIVPKHPYCSLTRNADSEKIWVWCAPDFAEEGGVVEQFALKFGQAEQATIFAEKFREAAEINKKLFGLTEEECTKPAEEEQDAADEGDDDEGKEEKKEAEGEAKEGEKKEGEGAETEKKAEAEAEK
uniref:RanBD1 domain-containing protein n=1 Tax=Chromera velia CCMP2878 TaxID=1169474 RepID=A0A0G4GDV0_9ALVE|mmetsp:Transcript_12782/g.24938  ORF Transcript_12782/g.24938 Transcript_12782/m.24938 type:complete len:251 (-) Transcript_12782:328-1080(-)|eukprot:Cvel_21446.t1-p1 / transcript=Cvel_21446.t1 / gene=Cvel_21446 / organism=Chromera_velia_CCMP2878 / gene_product=Ran-specific GTPase-activating protein 1, putative / transcript_product=Ran-specific GTPase-activating protein 1, putative / location=Cvel_scaffold2011:19558-21402(-) / protein_length=250 / sequence_SO=supercontig / SO=protein_coding / is_pseudo=false